MASSVHGRLPLNYTVPRTFIMSRGLARGLVVLWVAGLLGGCGAMPSAPARDEVRLPLLRGWFDGEEVFYVTTDVSHADVAKAKDANFAPRLADALPTGVPQPGRGSAVDKVYAITNQDQASVFASAPGPMGHANKDAAYSPLWQLVKVTWASGAPRRTLRSEEEILDAVEKRLVAVEATRVVLNCPIVYRRTQGGGLPGVSLEWSKR